MWRNQRGENLVVYVIKVKVPPSHALRLLHACAFCVNGGVWSDGIPILLAEQEELRYR